MMFSSRRLRSADGDASAAAIGGVVGVVYGSGAFSSSPSIGRAVVGLVAPSIRSVVVAILQLYHSTIV